MRAGGPNVACSNGWRTFELPFGAICIWGSISLASFPAATRRGASDAHLRGLQLSSPVSQIFRPPRDRGRPLGPLAVCSQSAASLLASGPPRKPALVFGRALVCGASPWKQFHEPAASSKWAPSASSGSPAAARPRQVGAHLEPRRAGLAHQRAICIGHATRRVKLPAGVLPVCRRSVQLERLEI